MKLGRLVNDLAWKPSAALAPKELARKTKCCPGRWGHCCASPDLGLLCILAACTDGKRE